MIRAVFILLCAILALGGCDLSTSASDNTGLDLLSNSKKDFPVQVKRNNWKGNNGSNGSGTNSKRRTLIDEVLNEIQAAGNGLGLSAFVLPASNDYQAIPQDPLNPLTRAKVALGEFLFHDTAFSQAGVSDSAPSWSCASCHHSEAGFKAGIAQGVGEGGVGFSQHRVILDSFLNTGLTPDVQPIASPTILNGAYQDVMLWNGQFGNSSSGVNAGIPESQLATPGTPKETNLLQLSGLETQAIAGSTVHRLKFESNGQDDIFDDLLTNNKRYRQLWDRAYPQGSVSITEDAGKAIAAYERTVLANQSPFQKFLGGKKQALTNAELRGAKLFFGKAGCVDCHRGPALSSEVGATADQMFFALGFDDLDASNFIQGDVDDATRLGRGGLTGDSADFYKFKIPQLYNLDDSSIFGHGASFTSVRSVIEYKNGAEPQKANQDIEIDSRIFNLGLSNNDIDDLVAFLEDALYDPDLGRYESKNMPSGECAIVSGC